MLRLDNIRWLESQPERKCDNPLSGCDDLLEDEVELQDGLPK